MIKLMRLDGSEICLNPDHIEVIEETPDTHITLTNGNRYLVLESALAITEKIIAFKARIMHRAETFQKRKYLKKQQLASFRPVCKLTNPERQ
jgi:flagellar protein FlbD